MQFTPALTQTALANQDRVAPQEVQPRYVVGLTSSPARVKIEPDVVEDEFKPQSDIYSTLKASFDAVASGDVRVVRFTQSASLSRVRSFLEVAHHNQRMLSRFPCR